LQATGSIIAPDFLPGSVLKRNHPALGHGPQSVPQQAPDESIPLPQFIEEQLAGDAEELYERTLRRMERMLLSRVLQHTNGNQVQAAKILGITRGSLRNKLRDLGITIGRTVEGSDEQD